MPYRLLIGKYALLCDHKTETRMLRSLPEKYTVAIINTKGLPNKLERERERERERVREREKATIEDVFDTNIKSIHSGGIKICLILFYRSNTTRDKELL